MTAIVRAANAAEFLSFVPHLLGFRPSRSLVLIPFDRSQSIGAMRIDLPDLELDGEASDRALLDTIDGFAATAIGMVCRVSRADGFAVVTYTDRTFADADDTPHRRLIEALRQRADACGLSVKDALCVASDAWGSYFDGMCPTEGYPLAELGLEPDPIDGTPLPGGDQASGATLPHSEPEEQNAAARALAMFGAAVAVVCGPDAVGRRSAEQSGPAKRSDSAGRPGSARRSGAASAGRHDAEPTAADPEDLEETEDPGGSPRVDPLALAAVCALDDLPKLFEDVLAWDAASLSPYRAATLAWCLARPALRDIALVQWCRGFSAGDEALDAQLRWEAGEEYPTHLAMMMWGEGDRPDPGRLGAALELTRRVAAVTPEAMRAGPLATAAWLSWALGRSTHADRYATLACAIEPEHGLSEIVRSFTAAGHLPDWAFRPAA